jgi:uncharacterized membrane protein YphA (DoxX/SURF4 family)
MNSPYPKAVIWIGRVISTLVTLPLVMSSIMKFLNKPEVVQGMEHLGIPASLTMTIAVLEILCVIVYAIPQTAVVGAILLTGYMGGTIITHLRMHESVVVQTLIPILAWLGLYLREPKLASLIPVRRD